MKKKTETTKGQTRFEFTDPNDISAARYAFRFDVHLRNLNTGSSELQELASRVTHIIQRNTIQLNSGTDERPSWIKIFDNIPYLPVKPQAKTRQIEVRAEAKPTAAEIKKIIETFANEERKGSPWNNVGFETDKGNVWVDRYRLHSTVHFSKEASTVFPASDLHARLLADREKILKGVIIDEAAKTKWKKSVPKEGA